MNNEQATEPIGVSAAIAEIFRRAGSKYETPTAQAENTVKGVEATRFVLLKGIKSGNTFFSSYYEGDDPTISATGETWYEILGFANTVAEAQMKLYGRTFPLPQREPQIPSRATQNVSLDFKENSGVLKDELS